MSCCTASLNFVAADAADRRAHDALTGTRDKKRVVLVRIAVNLPTLSVGQGEANFRMKPY